MRNKNVTIYFLLSAFSLVANRPGRSSISPAAVSQGGTPTPSPRTVTWKTPPSRSLGIDSEIRYFASVLAQAGVLSYVWGCLSASILILVITFLLKESIFAVYSSQTILYSLKNIPGSCWVSLSYHFFRQMDKNVPVLLITLLCPHLACRLYD